MFNLYSSSLWRSLLYTVQCTVFRWIVWSLKLLSVIFPFLLANIYIDYCKFQLKVRTCQQPAISTAPVFLLQYISRSGGVTCVCSLLHLRSATDRKNSGSSCALPRVTFPLNGTAEVKSLHFIITSGFGKTWTLTKREFINGSIASRPNLAKQG